MTKGEPPTILHKIGRFIGSNFRGIKGIDFLLRKIHPPDKLGESYFHTIVRGIPEGALYEIESRWFTEWTTYFYGSQDQAIHKWIVENSTPDWVSMDIGMNYGYFTCLLAKRCERVHGFEPVPWLAERAQRNIQLNKFTNAFVENVAVSDKNGTMRLNLPSKDDSNWGTSSLVHASGSNDYIDVETQTLDTFCDVQKIDRLDFIKIDVEGAEHMVLRGGKNTLVKFRPKIIFENNEESISKIKVHLESMNYKLCDLAGNPLQFQSTVLPHDILAIPN